MSDSVSDSSVPKPPLLQGISEGADFFEVVKLLVRTRKSGVLGLSNASIRAEIWIREGAILGAFFNELAGAQALTRTILTGAGTYIFEHHEGKYPHNITQSTAHIIASIENVLADCGDRLWGLPGDGSVGEGVLPTAGAQSQEEEYLPDTGQVKVETMVLTAFAPPETGRVLGKCLLEEEIGRGASSVVYKARHKSLDLQVVVKVLMQSTGSKDDHHQALSRNEAQLLARLNHPHILRVFDFGERGPFPHLVMEYVDGTSLSGLIEKSGAVEAADALPIFCQVAEGDVLRAHGHFGLVHCDIKPSNIMLTRAMEAKVADFGLAKVTRMTPSQLKARDQVQDRVAGTPAYIAPEQVEGGWDSATHRSDIYALGATFYHALTGKPPFDDPDPIELMAKRLRFGPIPRRASWCGRAWTAA